MAEERKILVEVEHNLNKYRQEATETAKRVADLKDSIRDLQKQDKDYAKELQNVQKEYAKVQERLEGVTEGTKEANELKEEEAKLAKQLATLESRNAEAKSQNIEATEELKEELRGANSDYRDATKAVDDLTRANESNEGSYDQLQAELRLAERALKEQEGLLIQNADGTYELSEGYVEASESLEKARDGVNNFNKGIHQGNTNVGLYEESIENAAGKLNIFGVSGSKAMEMTQGGIKNMVKSGIKQFKMFARALALNPIMLLIMAIVAAVALMGKAWQSFTARYDAFGDSMQSTSAGISAVTDKMTDDLVIGLEKVGVWLGNVWESTKEWFTGIVDGIDSPMDALNLLKDGLNTISEGIDNAKKRTISWFKDTAKSAKQFVKDAIDDPRAALDRVTDKVKGLVTSTGDWLKEVTSGEGEYAKIFNEAKRLEDQMIALGDSQKAFRVESAQANLEIKQLEEIYRDVRIADEERIEAAHRARELEIQRADEELRMQREKVSIIEQQNSLAVSGREDVERLQEAQVQLIQLEERSLQTRIRVNRQLAALEEKQRKEAESARVADLQAEVEIMRLKGEGRLGAMEELLEAERDLALMNADLTKNEKLLIDAQYNAGLRAIADQRRIEETEEAQRSIDIEREKLEQTRILKEDNHQQDLEAKFRRAEIMMEAELQIMEQQRELVLSDETLTESERQLIVEQFRTQELQLEAAHNEAKRQLSQARIDQLNAELGAIAGAMGAFSQLAKEDTVAQKAFAVAQAGINAYLAGSQVLANPTLGPVGKTIAMLGVIASGLANVRNILKIKVPEGGGAAPSVPSPSTTTPSVPTEDDGGGSGYVATRASNAGAVGANAISSTATSVQGGRATNVDAGMDRMADKLGDTIKKQPPPVVAVTDIHRTQDDMNQVETQGNL